MKYKKLGKTDIDVSLICLGTMTWGKQNTQEEGHQQMDYALSRGVNFWDTAEMYPVPPGEPTYGHTEEIIGNWFKKTGRRKEVILASKIAGPDERLTFLRGGTNDFSRKNIMAAIDASLKRLQTDYIDLFQLHWPERTTNYFGVLGYEHVPNEKFTPFEEILSSLGDAIRAGKIRHAGLSNESAWGTMAFVQSAKEGKGPHMQSIQNPYHLLNRSFEVGLSEVAIREQCGLLAYSPLAMGVLTGKYLGGARPEGARLSVFKEFTRYANPEKAEEPTRAYVQLAKKYGLTPTHLALAFVNSRDFVTSNIIGATNLEQLKENIDSVDVVLSDEILKEIEEIHSRFTYPCP